MKHRSSFRGEAFQSRKIRLIERGNAVGIEIDDAHVVAFDDQGSGHFTLHALPGGNVSRLTRDIGNKQWPPMQRDPAGHTLSGSERKIPDVGRQTLLDADFKFAVVGIDERKRSAFCRESGHNNGQHLILRGCGSRAGRKGCNLVQYRQIVGLYGTHQRRDEHECDGRSAN